MIKAIIFDLNGIFIISPRLGDRIEKDFGISTATFVPKLFEIMDKVRQSNAGSSWQYWEPVLRSWNINLSGQEFWDYWFKGEAPSDEMVQFAKELKGKGIKVFVLSNNFKERAEYYSHYPWMHDMIEKAYFSCQTGFVKPDPQAWKKILEENNLKPEECLYFDDQEKNIQVSQGMGIKSFIFTDNNDLKEKINQHLQSI